MKKSLFLVVLAVLVAVFAISCDGESAAAEPKKFTVKFDLKGGTSAAIDDQTVVEGEKAKEPAAPTRDGYTFECWKLGEEAFNFNTPITKDITLVASWGVTSPDPEPEKYTVTFDYDDDGTTANQEIEVPKDSTVKEPEDPTREGYAFKGWYIVNEAEEKKFEFDTPITGDIELKAKWEINKYIVTFDVDGDTTTISALSVEHGSCASVPADPTKTGHTFKYWSLDGSKFNFNTPITEDITLKAEWEPNEYTVTFDVDGDTTKIPAKTVAYGKTAEAPTTVPTKTGYGFDGWYAGASATTAFDFENTAIEADITLSARWVKLFSVDATGALSLTQEGKDYIDKGPITIEIPATFDGEDVTTIKNRAFSGRKNITAITIPSSVHTIEEYAFSNTGITSIEIPNSVTTVGNGAFQSCSALRLVEIYSKNAQYGIQVFMKCTALDEVIFHSEMTSEISQSMFQSCGQLSSITIPKSVKKIGPAAFWETGLTSVELADDASYYRESFPASCVVSGGALQD